ncbi:hypothetical protein [Leucobacter ruminantium]|uniref:Uncharacterized protein n=1 Tax=Leucobacter ruminantium TaxID=1289170 RepID=A0A939RZW5_9MICO|nr:hypothetical protein [Leucobacter ruminantium]MBO1805884.1 hypothetical protein [Leucobacter ruminantium]
MIDEPVGDEQRDSEPEETGEETLDGEAQHRKLTGDPELDELWSMRLGELRKIAKDPEHPLYDKANQVAAEMMKPLEGVARDILKPIIDSMPKPDLSKLMPGFDFSKHLPPIDTSRFAPGVDTAKIMSQIDIPQIDFRPVLAAYDTSSWVSQFAKNFPKIKLDPQLLDSFLKVKAIVPTAPMPSPLRLPDLDYTAHELPELTASEVEEASEEHADEIREEVARACLLYT